MGATEHSEFLQRENKKQTNNPLAISIYIVLLFSFDRMGYGLV
jgi:hypothetical protein